MWHMFLVTVCFLLIELMSDEFGWLDVLSVKANVIDLLVCQQGILQM